MLHVASTYIIIAIVHAILLHVAIVHAIMITVKLSIRHTAIQWLMNYSAVVVINGRSMKA